jgi:hypothetical protein
MWCKVYLFVLVVIVVHRHTAAVCGFSLELTRGALRGRSNSTFTPAPVSDDSSVSDTNANANANVILNFEGEFSHRQHLTTSFTETMRSTSRLYEFFQNRVHRNLLLKGGDNPTDEIPWTPELLEEWAAQARVVSSAPPRFTTTTTTAPTGDDEHHSVVAIHSIVPIVPGLFVNAISYMGCRLLPHPKTLLPMYEFTLIQDRCQAGGTRPLVWLYRKVTGDAPTNKKTSSCPLAPAATTTGSRKTHGLCRVFLEPSRPSGAQEVLRLSYYSMVKVSCNLPQRLLKILPLSKQSIEAKISASMAKQLETEVMQSANKFHTALEAWLQQSHREES